MIACSLVASVAAHHPGLASLRIEAAREGFRFLDKLVVEWTSGVNRFDRPGECLLGASLQGVLVGVGGLNCDPYTEEPGVARLRHLYVSPPERGRGIGASLAAALIAHARPGFARLRLRTDTADAAAFYRAMGFEAVAEDAATHALSLT